MFALLSCLSILPATVFGALSVTCDFNSERLILSSDVTDLISDLQTNNLTPPLDPVIFLDTTASPGTSFFTIVEGSVEAVLTNNSPSQLANLAVVDIAANLGNYQLACCGGADTCVPGTTTVVDRNSRLEVDLDVVVAGS